MQAVSLRRPARSRSSRWLLHAVLGLFIPLVLGSIGAPGLSSDGPGHSIRPGFRLPDSSPALLEWLPARNPARIGLPRDPSPPFPSLPFFARPAAPPIAVPVPAPPRPDLPVWVQTHRDAGLFGGPADDAPRFTSLPAWSYLKVVDSAPGWLLVRYEGDGWRQAGQAWVPAESVGPIGAPRWLVNPRETSLFAGPEANAPSYTRLPAWSVLEELGRYEGGRALVHYAGDGDARQPGQAWARLNDLDVARAPADSRLPWGITPGGAGDRVRLAVPARSQLDGSRWSGSNCGPVSVGMALGAFGLHAPTADLRSLANSLMGVWDPDGGVSLDALHGVVRRNDARPLELELPDGSRRRWDLEDVRRHLRAGHPVIPQLRYRLMPGREGYPVTYDHYVVLTGFEGETFFYNDPIPTNGRGRDLSISGPALLRAWQASDEPLVALAVSR